MSKIVWLLRHLLSILLLPFVVVVVVPRWLLAAFHAADTRWTIASLAIWLPRLAGGLLVFLGFTLFAWCVVLFIRVGRGTLAPWDPTRSLVAAGPYRLSRNPMISGVALILLGQAVLWGSWIAGAWAVVFILLNHVYLVLLEEPGLERRFGESYRAYKARVPRWLPPLNPTYKETSVKQR